MRILAIEKDQSTRDLYRSYFANCEVECLQEVGQEINAQGYDIVIVNEEKVKHYLTNIRYDHVVVAATQPTAKKNGAWALTKPFYMSELQEIVQAIVLDKGRTNLPSEAKKLH